MNSCNVDVSDVFGCFEYSGTLISIVGFDGSGKTTQLNSLAKRFQDKGYEVLNVRQPTDWYRNLGDVKVFHDQGGSPVSAKILALLAAADRQKHVYEVILPALKKGQVVLVDRYVYATFGVFVHRGVDLDFLVKINAGIPRPDFAFYLKMSPVSLRARLDKRDGDNLQFEERKLERISSVISTYENMPNELINIDAEQDLESVSADIIKAISHKFEI